MDVKYQFNNINKKGMMYGVGDLLKYYADVSLRLREKLDLLKNETRIRDALTGYLRKKTGSVGITIDSVFTAVEVAIEKGDMFYFKVDGKNFCDWIKDKESIELEVHMDDNYFITQMALAKFNPTSLGGFRKKYPEGIEGERLKWMHWFEGEWKKDMRFKGFGNPNFEKTMLEEK